MQGTSRCSTSPLRLPYTTIGDARQYVPGTALDTCVLRSVSNLTLHFLIQATVSLRFLASASQLHNRHYVLTDPQFHGDNMSGSELWEQDLFRPGNSRIPEPNGPCIFQRNRRLGKLGTRCGNV